MGPGSPFSTNVQEADISKAQLISQYFRPYVPHGSKNGVECRSIAWSPDSSYVAWSCGKGIIKLIPWNPVKNCLLIEDDTDLTGRPIDHPRVLRTIETGSAVYSLAFGCKVKEHPAPTNPCTRFRFKVPDELVLAAGLKSGRIRTWVVRTGRAFLVLMDHTSTVTSLAFAPDTSQRLLSGSRDGSLKLWHLDDDGNMSHTFRGTGGAIHDCAWSPNAKTICGVGEKRGVYLWDVDTFAMRQLRGHVNDVCSCAFTPDGAVLATASYDTSVILWDPHLGTKLAKLRHLLPEPREWMVGGANDSYVRGVTISRNGRHIVTICDDGYLRVWDILKPDVPIQIDDIDKQKALCCQFSSNGSVFVVGARNGSMTMWRCPGDQHNLQHLARLALRSNSCSSEVEGLELSLPPPPSQSPTLPGNALCDPFKSGDSFSIEPSPSDAAGSSETFASCRSIAPCGTSVPLPCDIQRFLRYEDLMLFD